MKFSSISNLWNNWNIRGSIILSLSLQVFLILFAPFRKKTTNKHIIFLLWLAYVMADWVAAFGIGLISHSQGNLSACAVEVDETLQAFWASFILLHLGGSDTITAFSLEDSSLWRRHLLTLIFQAGAAIYVFVQIFLSDKSSVIPTMLVFLAAVIKNVERTLALNLSSLHRLRESMLTIRVPSSDEDLELTISSLAEAGKCSVEQLDVLEYGYSDEEEANLFEALVVSHAYSFFRIFEPFLVDAMFTYQQRETSREYFRKVSAVDALRVISVELHFIYEVLHTKALVIYSKWSYIFRFLVFTDIVIASVMFNRMKKHQLPELDAKITYTLLFGGITLDVIASFMLVFSDWNVAANEVNSFLQALLYFVYALRKPRFATYKPEPNANVTYDAFDTSFICRRWSESMSACNLFSMVFEENPPKMYKCDRSWATIAFTTVCSFSSRMAKKIISCFHQAGETIAERCGLSTWKMTVANTKYVSKNPVTKKLWVFIYEEVRNKSEHAESLQEVRNIVEARGALSLKSSLGEIDCGEILRHVTEDSFDTSIMLWHVATEVWYNVEKPFTARNDEREVSKLLSDYMLYLFLNRPNVVSAVVGDAPMRSKVVVVELERLKIDQETKDVEELCKRLFAVDLSMESPLRRGINLAKEMERLGERKWTVMSGVWVEMLSYAAVHTKGEAHVQVLSKGGELLAFVWLLMVHFGCFYTPQRGIASSPL